MAILCDKNTKLLVQGMGRMGSFHARRECELDFARAELRRAGSPVAVTPLEFKLLSLFARRPGRVLTRRVLIDQAWGKETMITERVVDNQVANLRKKIEPAPARPQYLKSVRGIGYRFDLEGMTQS